MADTRRVPPTRSSLLASGALGAALLAVAACGAEGAGAECTMIGSSPGMSVVVRHPDAARVASASLRVCWDGTCREPGIGLGPSSTSVPLGCEGEEPDAVCAASASPDGGKTGFAVVEGLPKAPVQVTLELRDAGGRVLVDRRLDVTPKATYPNGPDCDEGAPQVVLTVADGTVTAA
ncbi:hypothetical protein [Actinomadura livida]|uniref:Secreted protein n=1 Tax=Actinomadura livida TaxID=79909 RepID=A0A7W7IHA5_9ACTN|nr:MULTISPECIES: hypothetical protein [Actinomadura]MBB4776733.1 hypothetical protein [Actinomadura catellatispora]GGT94443.1 hypothetical protein GCM10010208_17020 [Actinomadura livida]